MCRDLAEKLFKYTDRTPGGCWLWTGYVDDEGYGRFSHAAQYHGLSTAPHRVSYELLVGPIPEGLQVDHICHNGDPSCAGGVTCLHRRCVNPAHLEAVTCAVNVQRIPMGLHGAPAVNAAKTHCPQGHPFDGKNTYIRPGRGGRTCRACNRDAQARRKARLGDDGEIVA